MLLSGLLPFAVVHAGGRHSPLRDLAIDLAAGNYPPVTELIIADPGRRKDRGALRRLSWSLVASLDREAGCFRVADLAASSPVAQGEAKRSVWLKRDVLDALVIDLRPRRAVRVNDLLLAEEDGVLRLRGADSSIQGILRRLGPARADVSNGRRIPAQSLHDWQDIEFLRGDPRAAAAGHDYHRRIAAQPPGQIANLMEEVPYLHAAELLSLLPDATAAKALEAMSAERQLQVFEELDEDRAVRLLALIAPDIGADLLGRLPATQMKPVVEALPREQRRRLVELLRYPADTVGGIMTNDIVALPAALTVREARAALAARSPAPDFVHFIYTIDEETTQRLRGVLSLRQLVVGEEGQRLEELTNQRLLTLDPLDPAAVGAQRVTDSHLAALPVVAVDGRLVGAVTIDAAVAEVAPQAWGAQAPRIFS